ncbi:NADPH:quinone oxidoreductase family protein [Sphingopyxis sp. OPL5]|uniref:NADPH:quinone oxidoreductase family protein n=1 Tax=Sphingopyxis sp. OPL5 TaxID=2486273 RepID=UPI0008D2FF68|nr:NADPH:quinone oxidoreductase family protein [Sphingopyxis sp. OPL5]OHD03302.1 MAG: NADPH:quinone oxidoreductase [Sphingopyxis sp. RIFCSPHIGHO2_01_FULL_65_24]QNO28048.1 NADPH:quinone oxidoreductase family protein [Sphingopyxis sp. OPL5]
MQALQVRELAENHGGCGLVDLAVPEPGPGEVRVRVRAAAVNFPDLLMTRGAYQLKPDLPFVPGLEFAGEVEALGEGVLRWSVGDAVIGGNRFGAMADYVVVPAAALRAKPGRLSWEEAAAYGVAYLTAYVALVRCARVEAGETVLVHGAAGGVGLATVDLGKALGAQVIAAASSAEKRAALAEYYAPDAVIAADPGFRDEVKALTGGRGADVIFDPVGGDIFDESTRCIAFGGRLLVIGFASGRIPEVSVNMPLIKGFSVVGVRAGEYGRRFPARGAENIAAIDALAAGGRIRPHVHAALALADWREGFAMLERRAVVGKVVLIP